MIFIMYWTVVVGEKAEEPTTMNLRKLATLAKKQDQLLRGNLVFILNRQTLVMEISC